MDKIDTNAPDSPHLKRIERLLDDLRQAIHDMTKHNEAIGAFDMGRFRDGRPIGAVVVLGGGVTEAECMALRKIVEDYKAANRDKLVKRKEINAITFASKPPGRN